MTDTSDTPDTSSTLGTPDTSNAPVKKPTDEELAAAARKRANQDSAFYGHQGLVSDPDDPNYVHGTADPKSPNYKPRAKDPKAK